MGADLCKNKTVNYLKSSNTQKKAIFILGGPGTGKSTVAKAISGKYDMDYVTQKDYQIEDINDQGYRPCHKLRDLITKSTKSTILIEDFPKTKDDLVDWKNVISEHCAVRECIYLYCSNELMKYRLSEKFKSEEDFTNINILLSDYSANGIPSLGIIFEFVPIHRVSTEDSIEKVLFEICGILDQNQINIQIA